MQLAPGLQVVPRSSAATTKKSAPRNCKKEEPKVVPKNEQIFVTKLSFARENAKRAGRKTGSLLGRKDSPKLNFWARLRSQHVNRATFPYLDAANSRKPIAPPSQ